ncbi:MAG: hypothetical protein HRT66_09585 [Flavobacteriaceae bacterium]|nr:hypothetical protein [Flavobacteriaceae bacterium]
MPRKRQFGFVFSTSDAEHTLAHELGHGVFGLEHSDNKDLLMYGEADGGENFTHMDWDKMHAAGFKLYLFDDDDDGELGEGDVITYLSDLNIEEFDVVSTYINFDGLVLGDGTVIDKKGISNWVHSKDKIYITSFVYNNKKYISLKDNDSGKFSRYVETDKWKSLQENLDIKNIKTNKIDDKNITLDTSELPKAENGARVYTRMQQQDCIVDYVWINDTNNKHITLPSEAKVVGTIGNDCVELDSYKKDNTYVQSLFGIINLNTPVNLNSKDDFVDDWVEDVNFIALDNPHNFRLRENLYIIGYTLTSKGVVYKTDKDEYIYVSSDNEGDEFFMKYSDENKTWLKYNLGKPTELVDQLEDIAIGFSKEIGRYALPVEDILIVITGKDFDNKEASRLAAAGFIVLEVVQVAKLLKVLKAAKIAKGGKPLTVAASKALVKKFAKDLALDIAFDLSIQLTINLMIETSKKENSNKTSGEILEYIFKKKLNYKTAFLGAVSTTLKEDENYRKLLSCSMDFFSEFKNTGKVDFDSIEGGVRKCIIIYAIPIIFKKLGSNKNVVDYLSFIKDESAAKLMITTLTKMGLLNNKTKEVLEGFLTNLLKETTN